MYIIVTNKIKIIVLFLINNFNLNFPSYCERSFNYLQCSMPWKSNYVTMFTKTQHALIVWLAASQSVCDYWFCLIRLDFIFEELLKCLEETTFPVKTLFSFFKHVEIDVFWQLWKVETSSGFNETCPNLHCSLAIAWCSKEFQKFF